MEPVLSIIVPVYNTENYLRKCLDSILSQKLKDIEVICINDGSPDHSAEILEEYKKKDPRVVVITQKNQGLGAARNVGIRAAKGEYLGFVDSDDFIAPNMFEKLYKKAKKYDSDVVITNLFLYFSDTGGTQVFRDTNFYQALSETKFFTLAEHPKILQFIGVWDRIYRRRFIEHYHLRNPEQRIYEDVLFTVQTCFYAKRISVVNEPLYYYRKNTGISIVDKERTTDSYKFDFLKNLAESRDFLLQNKSWDTLRRAFLEFQLVGILYHQYNMQTRKSFLSFAQKLTEILSDDDLALMMKITQEPKAKLYLSLLRKHYFDLIFVLYKGSKLCHEDWYYIYFRFPKMESYFHIRKLGYFRRREITAYESLVWETQQLRTEISKLAWEAAQKRLKSGKQIKLLNQAEQDKPEDLDDSDDSTEDEVE